MLNVWLYTQLRFHLILEPSKHIDSINYADIISQCINTIRFYNKQLTMKLVNIVLFTFITGSGFGEILVIPFNEHHNLTIDSNQLVTRQKKQAHTSKLHLVPDATVPYFSELSEHCKGLLSNFSATVSTYLKCMTFYSKPAKLCQTCQYKLTAVERAYNNIRDDNMEPICPKLLLTSDSLHMIEREYEHAQEVWQIADCDYCYDNPNVEIGKWRVSNKTKEFFDLFNRTIDCFAAFLPINRTNSTDGNPGICPNCTQEYSALDKMFLSSFQSEDKICIDIFEAMNYTRIVWSRQYKCYARVRNLAEMIPIITLILVIPFLFYPGVKITMDIYDYRQKRKEQEFDKSVSNDYGIKY
ncbi:hypothetical protein LOD99_13846 [Oopsacas minuta]|uniref:Osteopetrosis-associated transmembrane protein 1 n=1 Tax=Oopsacas minuta TaxID=111878 RepID=A0AAV7KIX6_9METZ|nr:hypothetical protein LOD99_13846 [Oopsacas minuta]